MIASPLNAAHLSRRTLFLSMFAATLVIELLAMTKMDGLTEFDGLVGAMRDALLLACLVTVAYILLTSRRRPLAATIINSAVIAAAAFAGECVMHLLTLSVGGGEFLDAAGMGLIVGSCAAWLDFMEQHCLGYSYDAIPIAKAVGAPVLGGALFIVAIAAGAPTIGAMSVSGLDRAAPQSSALVNLVAQELVLVEAMGRDAYRGDRVATTRDLALVTEFRERIRVETERYVQLARLNTAEQADLPNSGAFADALTQCIDAAHVWLSSNARHDPTANTTLQVAVDAFSRQAIRPIAAINRLEPQRQANLHNAGAQIAMNLSLAALALGMLWQILRLTASKHAQLDNALKQSAHTLAELAAYKSALDRHAIVAMTDAKGKILAVNDKFAEISGYSPDELVGQDHRILNSGHHDRAFFVSMWRSIGSGQPFHAEICNRSKSGSLYWVASTIAPILGENGKPANYVAIRYDVTDRVNSLRALAEERALLEQRVSERTRELTVEKMRADEANAAKSAFLMTMSHELRTPLSSIISYAEVIAEDAEADGHPAIAEDAAVITDAARILLRMISEILDFSKIEAGKLELDRTTFAGDSFFAEIAQTMRPLVEGNGNTLLWRVDALGELRTDRLRLRQCVLNLISNAAKFTNNGVVEIRVERHDVHGGLTICVRDSGIGITPAAISELFEPFKQADETITRRYGGTGLGLAITKSLVELLGGTIGVESREGVGSAFTIQLPAEAVGGPSPESSTLAA